MHNGAHILAHLVAHLAAGDGTRVHKIVLDPDEVQAALTRLLDEGRRRKEEVDGR